MTWEGVRDERLLSADDLRHDIAAVTVYAGMDIVEHYMERIEAHIDALHDIMGRCHELLAKTRADEMLPRDRGWSTVAAVEVLLENHLPKVESTS